MFKNFKLSYHPFADEIFELINNSSKLITLRTFPKNTDINNNNKIKNVNETYFVGSPEYNHV